jgi:hypothetical protein
MVELRSANSASTTTTASTTANTLSDQHSEEAMSQRYGWRTVVAVALGSAAATAVVLMPFGRYTLLGHNPQPVGSCELQGMLMHGYPNDVPIVGGPKGSCWCGAADGYCLCTPSLSVDVGLLACVAGSQEPHVALVTRRFPPMGKVSTP